MTDQLNKLCLYALNYDLLLQYPIHRLHGSLKISRPLQQSTDESLIAEETLTVEAFELIESLYKAERNEIDNANTKKQELRLKRLLPLLLYRYRPCEEISTKIEEEKNGEPMTITKNQKLMQVLPFNFRPYNTGLLYENWPLGRTQELILTAENNQDPTYEQDLLTGDSNVYYVAEPVDKLDWLSSKRSINTEEPFNVIKFYENIDAFFLKYAPRARMIRKARFRSTLPESRFFRQFLFETVFYKNGSTNQVAQTWDCAWRNYLSDPALVAHLLVQMQPTSVETFGNYCSSLNSIICFATAGWTVEQRVALQQLLRATPYEKSLDRETALKISAMQSAIVELVVGDQKCSVKTRAATMALYVGLQSRFTAYTDDVKTCVNSIYRIVTTLEQSIDVEKTTFETFFSNWQLWHLSKHLVAYLQTLPVQLDSLEIVSDFLAFVTKNVRLFSDEAIATDLLSVHATLTKK